MVGQNVLNLMERLVVQAIGYVQGSHVFLYLLRP